MLIKYARKLFRPFRRDNTSLPSTLKSHFANASNGASKATSQTDAQNHDNRTASPPETVHENDKWMKAYDELRRDESKRKELDDYDRILEQHYGEKLARIGTPERRNQMLELTDTKLKDLQTTGAFSEKRKNAFDVAIKSIIKSKEVISAAAQPCLPASVACAGFLFLLSIYDQTKEERQFFYESVKDLSWSVYNLTRYEELLWNRNRESSDPEVEELFVQSYSNILYFQAQAALYLEKSRFQRGLEDAFRVNRWKELIADVKKAQEKIHICVGIKDSEDLQAMPSKIIDILEASSQVPDADNLLQQLLAHAYPYKDRKNRNAEPVEGTCEWFANQELFRRWNSPPGHVTDSSSALLYVTADPGCGKSVLARHLVDKVLLRDQRTICYAFFKDDFDDQKTSLGALCALLHQLLSQNMHLMKEEVKILNSFRSDGARFFDSFATLWEAFTAAASHQKTVCVIDALDECRDGDRSQLIAAISKVSVPTLQFLLTSRPWGHVTREIKRQNKHEISSIHIQGDQGSTADEIAREIQLVANFRINDVVKHWELSASEHKLLREKIGEVPNRTYLWLTLIFDGLMSRDLAVEKKDILTLTTELPAGIDAAYEKLLSKSKDQGKARTLLKIVLAAVRPLTLTEMAIALAFNDQSTWSDLMEGVQPRKAYVRDLCGLFVNVVNERVYLLHQTAREFLLPKSQRGQNKTSADESEDEKHTPSWQHSISLTDSNEVLARLSVNILQLYFYDVDLSASVSNKGQSIVQYSSMHWVQHYRQSSVEFQEKEVALAEDLCFPREERTQWLSYLESPGKTQPSGTLLGVASAFGLDRLVFDCVEDIHSPDVIDIDVTDETGRTPLNWATFNGHVEVVKILLATNKVDVNIADESGYMPLHRAASDGREDLVMMLLATGKADVDMVDVTGWTPLHHAAMNGNVGIVKALLATNKVDVDRADVAGSTPLHYAAWSGHVEVVRMLLATNRVDVDRADGDGLTPLHRAVEGGDVEDVHVEVVKMLLTIGKADASLIDNEGMTALAHAEQSAEQSFLEPDRFAEIARLLTRGKQ